MEILCLAELWRILLRLESDALVEVTKLAMIARVSIQSPRCWPGWVVAIDPHSLAKTVESSLDLRVFDCERCAREIQGPN